MDRQISLGLIIGLIISGVACLMITISQLLGIGLISGAVILSFLFLYPKSPVKKVWWINSKLGISIDGQPVLDSNMNILRVDMNVVALSEVTIESVYLEITGKRVPSDWETNSGPYWEKHSGPSSDCLDVRFSMPKWLLDGEYDIRLVATTKDGRSRSPRKRITITGRGRMDMEKQKKLGKEKQWNDLQERKLNEDLRSSHLRQTAWFNR